MGNIKNNIAIVIPYLKSGGGNKVMIDLANGLSINNKVFIYTFSKEEKNFKLKNNIKVIYLRKKKNILDFCISLLKVYFFLHFHCKSKFIMSDPILSLITIFCFRKKNIYRFIQANDMIIYDDKFVLKYKFLITIYKYLTKVSYNIKIKYIFNSNYVYNTFLNYTSENKKCKKIIINPYPDYEFNSNFKINKKIHEKKLVISTIARLHPWKGYALFERLIRTNINNPRIKKVKIITPDKIHFVHKKVEIIRPKKIIEISNNLLETDIFISTSWWEGYGLPQLEALKSGCIGLFSDSKGINEFSKNFQNVLLFKPKNFLDLNQKFLFSIYNISYLKTFTIKNNLYTSKVTKKKFLKKINMIF